KEGYPFIALFAGVNLLAFLLSAWLGWALLPITLWCIAFFRDPDRKTPDGAGLIICPADGKLLPIIEAVPPIELGLGETPRPRLSIFMNVFNVHVNRNPISGSVVALAYRAGKFFNASFDKASIHNERMSIRLRPEGTDGASDLAVVQIAGLVARRIVCELTQGQGVQRGARFGIIRFGSRVDVYLPPGTEILVQPGITTRAGETVLARFV
ncbi:MAG TPA: phosphatidylserine decarboxylase, partial [Rhizomicrobium sp.]|nr:phosphatidylserine decarboxylase [Rhizomicrobium sp.]